MNRKAGILVVDDEEGILESISGILGDEGYDTITTTTGEDALNIISDADIDLVILDVWLPGIDGIETLKKMKEQWPDIAVLMVSGHGNIDLAVKATKLGAYDFLEKPLSLEKVIIAVERAIERKRLETENRELRESIRREWDIVGKSPVIESLKAQIRIAGPTNSRVIILGESGTGKELVARALHEASKRNAMPFVEVNCAAIPHELIESELFGHEKGSFTGAFEKKKGKFELADGGTLFLDEVGDMAPGTQAKVLRVIETQEFQRVGGSRNIKVDVRLIAATNKDLQAEIKKGTFREDLYYRLNVIPINIAPLRERKEDIPLLVEHFLHIFAQQYGQMPKAFSRATIDALMSYDWPGNVRELRNVVERMVIMSPSKVIEARDIPLLKETRTSSDYFNLKSLKEARDVFERDFITKRLKDNNWNVSRTAEELGIERSNLHRKIKALGINIL